MNNCPTCGAEVNAVGIFCTDHGVITYDGKEAYLTKYEMMLFRIILASYPAAVRKDAIFDQLYVDKISRDEFPSPKVIDVLISKIRRKISDMGIIMTCSWGYGYGLTLADPAAAEALKREGICNRNGHRSKRLSEEERERLRDLSGRGFTMTQIATQMMLPYSTVSRALERIAA